LRRDSLAGVALDTLFGGRRGGEFALLDGRIVTDVAVAVVRLFVGEDGRVGVTLVGDFGDGVAEIFGLSPSCAWQARQVSTVGVFASLIVCRWSASRCGRPGAPT